MMPDQDPPAVSLRKAQRQLGAAQRYLLRAGAGDLADEVTQLKTRVAAVEAAGDLTERRCEPCRAGLHYYCERLAKVRGVCGCLNAWHTDPREGAAD